MRHGLLLSLISLTLLAGCAGPTGPSTGAGGGFAPWPAGGGFGGTPAGGAGGGTGGTTGGGTGSATGGGAGGGSSTGALLDRVTGVVHDTQGRPIAGARVRIENDFSYYDVRTDADGRYVSPVLPLGGFKVVAWTDVTYAGQDYKLRLGMPNLSDYDYFTPGTGAVRNFRWQLTGRIPDREADGSTGYFGGTLELANGTGSIYEQRMDAGDTVVLQLEPVASLIDGSPAETLFRTVTVKPGSDTSYALDIPVGVYRVTAERVTPGGVREALRVGPFSQQGEWATVWFLPSGQSSYESGLTATALYLVLNR